MRSLPMEYRRSKEGFYEKNPAAETAVLEVMNQKTTPSTKGTLLGNYPAIRDKIIDYLEKALNGEFTPKEALDKAVEEGNKLLQGFEEQHTESDKKTA